MVTQIDTPAVQVSKTLLRASAAQKANVSGERDQYNDPKIFFRLLDRNRSGALRLKDVWKLLLFEAFIIGAIIVAAILELYR